VQSDVLQDVEDKNLLILVEVPLRETCFASNCECAASVVHTEVSSLL